MKCASKAARSCETESVFACSIKYAAVSSAFAQANRPSRRHSSAAAITRVIFFQPERRQMSHAKSVAFCSSQPTQRRSRASLTTSSTALAPPSRLCSRCSLSCSSVSRSKAETARPAVLSPVLGVLPAASSAMRARYRSTVSASSSAGTTQRTGSAQKHSGACECACGCVRACASGSSCECASARAAPPASPPERMPRSGERESAYETQPFIRGICCSRCGSASWSTAWQWRSTTPSRNESVASLDSFSLASNARRASGARSLRRHSIRRSGGVSSAFNSHRRLSC
mmetsp:Transcript_59374/g.128768  ORF Transcript_59374/g.128768 Transcript_59374/m.128768 type:complete len:286 (+) Transcript_59374:389-1246(+)